MSLATTYMARRFSPSTMKALREARGWSETKLAGEVGVTATAVRQWERGRNDPSLRAFEALSRVFDVPMDDLLEEVPED